MLLCKGLAVDVGLVRKCLRNLVLLGGCLDVVLKMLVLNVVEGAAVCS